jgi:hypothetical protein
VIKESSSTAVVLQISKASFLICGVFVLNSVLGVLVELSIDLSFYYLVV